MQYDVVLTHHQNNGYTARPVLWPKIVAAGDNEEDALENVRVLIAELQLQADSKIVQVDVAELELIEESEFAEQDRKMEQEERAYQDMLPMLREKYLGEFVAVYQGELVDHDEDELTLFGRIDKKYPDDIVLMTKVLAGPRPVLRIRSPRLISEPK